jgi:hypothetical protein
MNCSLPSFERITSCVLAIHRNLWRACHVLKKINTNARGGNLSCTLRVLTCAQNKLFY